MTLVGEWDYEDDKGDYKAFFAERVAFPTYPEVQPESFQTSGGERRALQPQYDLAPGKSLVVSWQTDGSEVREDDKNLLMLDVGSEKKIEKGDTFVIQWGLQALWRVTITKVHTWGSDGSVARLHHDGRPETPAFPGNQWLAMLEPEHGTANDE